MEVIIALQLSPKLSEFLMMEKKEKGGGGMKSRDKLFGVNKI
jgi:hypothetical protein